MQALQIHMKNYRAFFMMLILSFSLSPCSVKRDLLSILDIQYISGLNKVKTTIGEASVCDLSTESSSNKGSISKNSLKSKENKYFTALDAAIYPQKGKVISQNKYSGQSTGNSPPKYILFKRLKLDLI